MMYRDFQMILILFNFFEVILNNADDIKIF